MNLSKGVILEMLRRISLQEWKATTSDKRRYWGRHWNRLRDLATARGWLY